VTRPTGRGFCVRVHPVNGSVGTEPKLYFPTVGARPGLLAALFLSPETIEYHLCNVSRELEWLHRGELAVALVTGRISA
jgi:hypothetical protein